MHKGELIVDECKSADKETVLLNARIENRDAVFFVGSYCLRTGYNLD